MYLTKPMTELQEERYERDCKIYEEYSQLMKAHEGFITVWQIARLLAPKYGICPMTVRNSILRSERYKKGDGVRVEERYKLLKARYNKLLEDEYELLIEEKKRDISEKRR